MEKFVMENIFSGERESQILAANEVSNLTTKQKHKLAERGVIEPLISMLHSQDYEAIEAALFALLSLAFGSERTKLRIVKSGAIAALTNLLQSENKSLIELTVASLLILSSCKANKLPIASSGVIQILVEFLNEECSSFDNLNNNSTISVQTKLDAIATLHNLTTCREIIPLLVSSGLVFALLQLIHCSEKSSDFVCKAIALLEDIVSLSKDALLETADMSGAIRALVETVEEGSPQCREHAVRILLCICKSCRETYRKLILREGVMPGLLQLSVDGTWEAKNMASELLFLLRDCSNYGSRNEQSKLELVQQMMEEIDAEEGRAVDATTLRLATNKHISVIIL